ncbi:MAG: hypothetical protein A2W19_17215 [Spirochaetes bacterium RBG_16_49_21]|nr:MAG: hypothetical protein A2W19_17215 [Spirochaetes bacterium RBG_16_49_21]
MEQKKIRATGAAVAAALITAVFIMGSTSYGMGRFYHKHIMRGQVLAIEDNEIYLCIGTKDGAQVDQKLDVYRITEVGAKPQAGGPSFKRAKIGTIKITKIVDEHFAKAVIVSGNAQKYDVAELEL